MEGPAGWRICGPDGLPHGGRAASCETAPRRPFPKGPGCAFGACAGRRPKKRSVVCFPFYLSLYIFRLWAKGPPAAAWWAAAGRPEYTTHTILRMPRGANLGLLPNYCGWDLRIQFTFTVLNSCSSKARLMVKPSTLSFTVQASALCQTGIITLASAR